MVIDLRFKSYLFPFLLMTQGPIRYKHSLFHGISSASLAGNLPYFYLTVLYVGKYHILKLPSGKIYNTGRVKMLTNDCLHSIHSCKKEIRMIPI